MTNCDRSPNLLSRDAYYTLGVLKPCYTVEKQLGVSETSTHSTQSEATPIHASKVGKLFLHHEMKGSLEELSNNSTKHSISKEQLQGGPLMKQDILETYSHVFTGIGNFPGLPYKFQLKPNAKPARHAPRKVPIHLQEAFHEEIRNLEALGILEETKDVTEWVNSFVMMEKKLPIADFNKGYWMVELDPESRKYTTMALDIGRFQWMRLPMGSIVAQDVFQRKLDGIFLSIPGVTGIADDMIIYGRSDQEHDRHLLTFLEVCRKNNLTLNPEKMQFRLPQVSFFGHQWSARGLSPDPKKIDAVKRMELPQDVEMMRSFLGLVNYLNCFSPCLAELSDPLRQICRKRGIPTN